MHTTVNHIRFKSKHVKVFPRENVYLPYYTIIMNRFYLEVVLSLYKCRSKKENVIFLEHTGLLLLNT